MNQVLAVWCLLLQELWFGSLCWFLQIVRLSSVLYTIWPSSVSIFRHIECVQDCLLPEST